MNQSPDDFTKDTLNKIIKSETSLSTSGYPYISHDSFQLFLNHVPHLFQRGSMVLSYLDSFTAQSESEERALTVLRQIILTAAITAPSDLWLTKHLITIHRKVGTIDQLLRGSLDIASYSKKNNIDTNLLQLDFHFLKSRGYLKEPKPGTFNLTSSPFIKELFSKLTLYPPKIPIDIVEIVKSYISNSDGPAKQPLEGVFLPLTPEHEPTDWRAGLREVEIGAAVVPLVLALSLYKRPEKEIQEMLPSLPVEVLNVLTMAAMCDTHGKVTKIGERVLSKGAGPFGIIHAYHTYLNQHELKLKGQPTKTWVQRGANVAASQAANSRSFSKANDALDTYCKNTGYKFSTFIEHAVGKGEATRQRFERDGHKVHYIGADLEDAAIDAAIEEKKKGLLPPMMEFVRKADIGEPRIIKEFLQSMGIYGQNTVMMVGNGFHEIRQQTDEKMIEVFKGYAEANILLIFTEESALSDQDLLDTGYNTYHAGFKYVHELSGQGLRPDISNKDAHKQISWPECIKAGGYQLEPNLTKKGRTIYPYPRLDGENPSISVTYFCIPNPA